MEDVLDGELEPVDDRPMCECGTRMRCHGEREGDPRYRCPECKRVIVVAAEPDLTGSADLAEASQVIAAATSGDVAVVERSAKHPGGRLGTSARRQELEDICWWVFQNDLKEKPPSPAHAKIQNLARDDDKAFLKDMLFGKALPAAPREMPIPAPESGGRKGDVAADNEEDLRQGLEVLQQIREAHNPKVVEDDGGRMGQVVAGREDRAAPPLERGGVV